MSDTSKEELVSNIKEWIKLYNEITKFQNEIKDRKNKKKEMTNKLVSVMSLNNLDVVNINEDYTIIHYYVLYVDYEEDDEQEYDNNIISLCSE